ncbi:SRPBCC family protein [Janthinobacterium fluminis]|uniref:SRPBCC family protein n=1 Tax=Janthinobacterium fluminis TaxID=2987524 RepID=A0ABT5K8M3_9BURK|nr:SRPBCC family protein [Janthinobacterium fluminis]MDC8760825.1 SRPBCC family protein [Janthinobacterium fluminis]
MQNITDQTRVRRGRPGSWQFPTASLLRGNGADGGTDLAGAARRRRARAYAAGYKAAPDSRGERLATALGWLSIGVGLAHLLAPRAVAKAAGLPVAPLLMRAMGVRAMVCGLGLLNQPASALWRWSRVAGDAADLLTLGMAARAPGSAPARLAATAVVVTGVAALDVLACARAAPASAAGALAGGANPPLRKTVAVNRMPDECYEFWRDLERLPRFMPHLESVRRIDARRSHWKARGPAGGIEWDADITEDVPGQRLAWRSLGAAGLDHHGLVEFAPGPGGRGTLLKMSMQYAAPGGKADAARLFGAEPARQIEQDLRRFKQLLEAGEVATTDGQAAGRRRFIARLFHKEARP